MRGNLLLILLIFITIVLSIFSVLIYAVSDTSLPSTYIDTGISLNESYAYDDNTATYAYINTSTGNIVYQTFLVGSHQNEEDITGVDILLDIEVTGLSDDQWAIQYSENGGTTWNNLRNLATGNLVRQTLNYSDIQELTDNDWTWSEVYNDLRVRIQTVSVGGTDSAVISLYELYANITYDTEGPLTTIISPSDNVNFTANNVTFFFNTTDEQSGITNCSLIIESSVNLTNSSVIEGADTYFNQTFAEGVYDWNIRCYDNSSWLFSTDSAQRNFTIDLNPPTIIQNSPDEASTYNLSNYVVFDYTVNDISPIINCSLLINDSINKTDYNVVTGISSNLTTLLANGYYTWAINCSDGAGYSNQSETRNLTVDINSVPQVDSIQIISNISLNAGIQRNVLCNTTVSDTDGSAEITGVVATFFHNDSSAGVSDENSTHYTNSSCVETASDAFTKTYSCGFDLWYFSREGTWNCHINVSDNRTGTSTSQTTTNVLSLYALNVTPQIIDYGVMYAGNTSQTDIPISVSNLGNKQIDITLDGYAQFDGDGLAMNCTLGDINLSYERYDLNSGIAYASMTPLTDTPVQLDPFNLDPKNDTYSGDKSVYWKISVPKPQKGSCGGYVTFSAVLS